VKDERPYSHTSQVSLLPYLARGNLHQVMFVQLAPLLN